MNGSPPGLADREPDYRRYGLPAGNPYHRGQADPVKQEDSRLLIPIAGIPHGDEIDARLFRTEPGTESSAFLISGRQATGRTSLAKTLVHRYSAHRGFGEDLQFLTYAEPHHDSRQRICDILRAVRNHIIRRHYDKQQQILSQVPLGEDGERLSDLDLQARADFLAHVMRDRVKPGMHLGLLIEGMQNPDLMDRLSVVFKHVDAIIVVTRDDYDTAGTASAERLRERERWQEWATHITIPPITGDQARRLASTRWEHEAPDVLCPFELDGVRAAFDRRSEPVGRALRWLGWLLWCRLHEYTGDEDWPAAEELHLPAGWIEMMMRRAEAAP